KNYHLENLFDGVLPDRVVVCFVDSQAFAGTYKTNPFQLEHLNVKTIRLKVNGQMIPNVEIETNFTANAIKVFSQFKHNLRQLGYENTNDCPDLTPSEWANGFTFWVFNTLPT